MSSSQRDQESDHVDRPATGSSGAAPLRAGFFGAAIASLGFGTFLLLRGSPPCEVQPPSVVHKPDVQLAPQLPQPLPFETEAAQLAPPLPLPPITARIVTIESNPAPAYAPLESRVDHVVVKQGEVVAADTRLALVRSGELATC